MYCACTDGSVAVKVGVTLGVTVEVRVAVAVNVAVGVRVKVTVDVKVGWGVSVMVGVGVSVGIIVPHPAIKTASTIMETNRLKENNFMVFLPGPANKLQKWMLLHIRLNKVL
jgi:hypothetical protein